MTASEIAVLLENFSSLNPQQRAALAGFARETPLVYGQWKYFKKLWKLAEAPALNNEEADVALLAVLIARIECAALSTTKTVSWKQAATDAEPVSAKTLKSGNIEYSVGGRGTSWDSSGWRLQVTRLAAPKSGGLLSALENVKAALTRKTEASRVYDFDARTYIGSERKIALDGDILEISLERGWGRQKEKSVYRINVADPDFAYPVDQPPGVATLQYMKRRARRLLRKLSTERPALYRELLHATLRETYALSKNKELDPAVHWALIDALFVRSARWKQIPNGRGAYQLVAPRFVFKTREERAPKIWDGAPDWTREIFSDAKIFPEANAAALKVLREQALETPELSDALLQKFLESGVPILQSFATRHLAARLNAMSTPAPAILASALLLAGARSRAGISALLDSILSDPLADSTWRQNFAAALSSALGREKSHKRRVVAARMLSTRLHSAVSDKSLFSHLALFLESSEDADWILERVSRHGESRDLKFLDVIATLPEAWQSRVLETFATGSRSTTPSATDGFKLISKSETASNRIGWRFLAQTSMQAEQIRKLWENLVSGWHSEAIYEAAFSEAAAAVLWKRAGWEPQQVARFIDSRSYLWIQWTHHFSLELAQAILDSVPSSQVAPRLFITIARLKPEVADRLLEVYASSVRAFAPTATEIQQALLHYSFWGSPTSNFSMAPGWKFLELSAVTSDALREVFPMVCGISSPDDAFGDLAAQVLQRAELDAETISKWLQTSPPVERFSPRFFLFIIENAAPEDKIALLQKPSDEQWRSLRNAVLSLLQNDESLRAGFWSGVWNGLEATPTLLARFDDEFIATFNALSQAAFAGLLPYATGAHENFAISWLRHHEAALNQGDEILIAAATHENDAIRLWGLRRVRVLGLNVAVALRLMESGLPQPFALGREYFESAARDSQDEQEYALALCDSPTPQVQEYGRAFIVRRASTLLHGDTLQKLTQHFEPPMQTWVADQLRVSETQIDSSEFDRVLLKTKGRARRAKESVKARLTQKPDSNVDAGALVEMARGTVARDREWALQQLAARVLAGEEITNVTVER